MYKVRTEKGAQTEKLDDLRQVCGTDSKFIMFELGE